MGVVKVTNMALEIFLQAAAYHMKKYSKSQLRHSSLKRFHAHVNEVK